MSKIEEFHQALNTASRIAEAVCRSLGRDRSDNDKHTARCQFRKIENDTWTPMLLAVDMSYGYYGSSSGYSATSKEMGEYLAKAINKHMEEICALTNIEQGQLWRESLEKRAAEDAFSLHLVHPGKQREPGDFWSFCSAQ